MKSSDVLVYFHQEELTERTIVTRLIVYLCFIVQSFQGSQGRAYLFNKVWVSFYFYITEDVLVIGLFFSLYSVNVGCGPAEERVLLTGLHAVSDIYCECCKTTLGWKYVSFD